MLKKRRNIVQIAFCGMILRAGDYKSEKSLILFEKKNEF